MVDYDENSYAEELKKKPICRFCLSQDDALTNIYSTSNTSSQVSLSMQIMACVSIEVIFYCACVCLFVCVFYVHVDHLMLASAKKSVFQSFDFSNKQNDNILHLFLFIPLRLKKK